MPQCFVEVDFFEYEAAELDSVSEIVVDIVAQGES